MGERIVSANDLRFTVTDEGDGDAVVLLHGFPDTRALWRHQIPALTAAGYRAVAPDLRGRGGSEAPEGVENYFAPLILQDVTGIMDELDIERAHVVGHDWGAAIAWLMGSFEPERVASVTALSAGHPAGWAWPSQEQRRLSWYMAYFQLPQAEDSLRRDDWRLLREWTGDHPETAAHIAALTPDGALTAALNWYRANAVGGWFADPLPYPPVEAPVMGVWSDGDSLLTEQQMLSSKDRVTGSWRYERIDGASHWIPLDAPENLNALLLDFLGK